MNMIKNKAVRNALFIGVLTSFSYLICYFARNILSVMSPQIVETTNFTVENIGTLSTANMLSYAVGQLVNGVLGDKIKGKYLISGGLIFSGICNFVMGVAESFLVIIIAYSFVGFFLSMLYAPLTKLIAENTHPTHAIRCCLGLSFASLFGTPVAGIVAFFFDWKQAFIFCGGVLVFVGILFYSSVVAFERKGIVKYKVVESATKQKGSIKVLLDHEIIKYSFVSILTGIVRTSVVFWVPTYLSQYLGFSTGVAATIFTIMTCVQSASPYINNFLIFECILKRDMNKTVLFSFVFSTIGFILMFAIRNPFANIVLLLVALTMANGAANVLWSIYCPSLHETGMVSSATGFLDFLSYMAAAAANILFANAISQIGWGNLILVWAGLMFVGIIIALPNKFIKSLLKR